MKMGKSFLFNDEDISPVWCLGTKEKKKLLGDRFTHRFQYFLRI